MQRWRSTRSPEGGPWPAEQRAPASFLLALLPFHSAAHPRFPPCNRLLSSQISIQPGRMVHSCVRLDGFDASDSVIKMFFVKDLLASNWQVVLHTCWGGAFIFILTHWHPPCTGFCEWGRNTLNGSLPSSRASWHSTAFNYSGCLLY